MTDSSNTNKPSFVSNTVAAGAAAFGASLCCIAPLVLLSLGIGGVWISYLTALEPYQPIFVVITLGFLFLAFRKLYINPAKCNPNDSCALPHVLRKQRTIFWIVTVVLIALLAFPYYGIMFFE